MPAGNVLTQLAIMQGRRERGIERCVNHDLSVFIAKVMENYLAMGLEPRIFRLVEAFTD